MILKLKKFSFYQTAYKICMKGWSMAIRNSKLTVTNIVESE
jgi:hypothetical protein